MWNRALARSPTLTPTTQYVDSLSWSPDSTQIAYSAASHSGFTAQYVTRIYMIAAAGGEPHVIVGPVA